MGLIQAILGYHQPADTGGLGSTGVVSEVVRARPAKESDNTTVLATSQLISLYVLGRQAAMQLVARRRENRS